jgi:hypothetical protein
MTLRRVMAFCVAALAVVLTLATRGESQSEAPAPTPTPAPRERPRGVVENCSTRSMARFPRAFSDPHNVVVGPLVLVGAAYTPASTVRAFGGNKFPALVRAGHRVTVELSEDTRRVAALGYGPLPEGVELTWRDGHRVVRFVACRRGRLTFWSGFVLTSAPRCVPLDVWVDDEPTPRRVVLRMGVRRACGPG